LIYNGAKRTFDFVSSFLASIVLLLPILTIALIIMIIDKGNPFYKQQRVGKDGKPIYIYKFRSMKKGADNLKEMLTPEQLEKYYKEYKLDDDPRLIGYKKEGDGNKCFGAKIRSMSIDELPQIFFNICIKGDMSVIGPRPILESEIDENYTPAQKRKLLSVKPGLTGYWQAYARNNVGYKDGKRQEMELYYIDNQSVWLDIKILFKTVQTVLCRNGAK
ncbi:MAG: sugar transferase, partial [Firmicutes bacterium]|nr:sugar transferase [Bacillota bacterium]